MWQLFLGEVERMIVSSNAKLWGVFVGWQTCPQDAIVHHIKERADAVPTLVVEPDLEIEKQMEYFSFCNIREQTQQPGSKLVVTFFFYFLRKYSK